jgi:cytochrome c-type biogenesis protein CcmH/NrfF
MPKRLLQILFLTLIAFTMLGADDPSTTRLDHIGHKLVCQCGCGQILMECNHVGCPVSGPMLDSLEAQLAAGNSEGAILTNFITKYGPIVLAAPIRGGFDNVAWIVPYATYFLATLGVALLILYWHRRHTRLHPATPTIPTPNDPTTNALLTRIRHETTDDD